MSFQIEKKSFGLHTIIHLIDSTAQCYAGIIPSCGALLNNFFVKANNKMTDVVNGYKNENDLRQNLNKSFKGAILSPWINRINHASYTFNQKQYFVDKVWKEKDWALHGYLYDKVFEVITMETSDESATLILKNYYDGDKPGFPFTFETTVSYSLYRGNHLTCISETRNTGSQAMPFTFGWHPWFFNNTIIDDVELMFPCEYKVDVDDNLIPTGEKTPYHEFDRLKKIGDKKFDTCFRLKSFSEPAGVFNPQNEIAVVTAINTNNKIKLQIWMETGMNKYNYLQVYIPPQRNTIALEPMTSWPDAFNNKNDLIVLQPGESAKMKYGIQINAF